MKLLKTHEIDHLNLDYKNIVNSTLDVKNDSILIIDHQNNEKLNELIYKSLESNPKLILTSKLCSVKNDKIIVFENFDQSFKYVLNKIYNNYSELSYYGVTGTNGKTTTCYFINQLLGNSNLFVGTVDEENSFQFTKENHLTTPKLFNLVKLLSLSSKSINSVSIEVSSHALDQDRLKDLKFKISGFTNLSQDHLDYHGNIDNYFQAKLKLFQTDLSHKFVYIDNEFGKLLREKTKIPSYSVGTSEENDVQLLEYSIENEFIKFRIEEKLVESKISFKGPKFAENFLLAFGMLYFTREYETNELINKIPLVKNPPGRYQLICKNNKNIIIDYAHTPEAIREVIYFASQKYKKIVTILGAGGNRDSSKRKLMGNSLKKSNKVIISNDNPRGEDPMKIASEILSGIPLNKDVKIVLDRYKAIKQGINEIKNDEVLLILGKGHEKYQEIDGKYIDFSDAKVVEEILDLEI